MKRNSKKNNTDYSLAHVLYQKLGSDWYAFTELNGDCFMSKVDAAVATGQDVDCPSDILATDRHQSKSRRKAA